MPFLLPNQQHQSTEGKSFFNTEWLKHFALFVDRFIIQFASKM